MWRRCPAALDGKTIMNAVTTTFLLFTSLLLSSCAGRLYLPPMDEDALKAKRWQVSIPAHDGGRIAATVWQPALAAGESAPLVLHTHGFGLQRMDGVIGLYENLIPTGKIAKDLWKQGFWLLTWDQRGHGGSGGVINVMDPDKEVRDVSTLLDWAETNIRRLARDADGDIRVGMIGESYGGGVQLLASAHEPRIDAIVPITTWHDLPESLAPSDVPKGGWVKVLYRMGDWVNFRKLHPYLRANFKLARKGQISEELKARYADHGLAYHCEQGQYPQVDALLVQGFRDVLFNMQQALANRDCLAAGGGQVHLIAQSGGHLLPFKQRSPSTPIWYWDKHLACLEETANTRQLVGGWLAARLNDQIGPALPPVCLSGGDWGVALAHWPTRRETIELPAVTLRGKRSGGWRWLTGSGDWLLGWRREKGLSQRFAEPRDSGLRPAFIPLHTASTREHRFGTAELLLKADQGPATPVLAALVVRRAGKARLKPVNDQLVPVVIGKQRALPPLSVELKKGDQLGLALFSRHPQFNTLPLDFAAGLQLSGTLLLPASLDSLIASDDSALAIKPEVQAAVRLVPPPKGVVQ